MHTVMHLLVHIISQHCQLPTSTAVTLCVQMERALFEDVLYYMHYCMGIYGWTLHVFQNPLTGLCSLGSVTWYAM